MDNSNDLKATWTKPELTNISISTNTLGPGSAAGDGTGGSLAS